MCSLEEGGLGSGDVVGGSLPCLEDRLLEGAAVREGECPWAGAVNLVHSVQVDGGALLGLATREEGDAWEGGHDGAGEGTDSHPCDLLGGSNNGASGTLSDHVGLKEGSLDDEVVVEHGLHHGGEDVLRDAGALLDGVVTVGEDLGLDDGHETVVLADGTVAGEGVGGLADGEL